MRGRKLSRGKSRKLFRNGSRRFHKKNSWDAYYMRGGIRL